MTCSDQAYRVAIGTFHGILPKILSRKVLISARRVRGLRVKSAAAVNGSDGAAGHAIDGQHTVAPWTRTT